MKKIYEKNELTFALISIGIYVVSQSIANSIHLLGIEYSANAVVSIVLTVFLFFFINKNGLPAGMDYVKHPFLQANFSGTFHSFC